MALVLGSVIIGVLFQFIAGQGRYVDVQSAREEVQQNTRSALELIGSELRTLPAGEALLVAEGDEIAFRTARVWGAVCAVTGATSLDIAIPQIAGASYSANAGTGLVVNLGTVETPDWSSAVGVTAVGGAAGTCNGAAMATGSERRSLTLSATPQNSGGVTPAIGDVVYLYDEVTYRTNSSNVPGVWIQRRLGAGAYQPMAGPVRDAGGLRFAYYADGSALPLATPVANRASVTRVKVVIDAVSRNRTGNTQQAKADTVVVSLRNRGGI